MNSSLAQVDTSDDEIFIDPAVAPEYPGGQNEMYKFVFKNINMLGNAGCMQGTVYVEFIVEPDGCISDICIIRGIHKIIDDQIINAISLMPDWIPGTMNGISVSTRVVIPIKIEML